MRKQFSKFALVAGIMLALAFTFSCSSDDPVCDDDGYVCNAGGGGSSSSVSKNGSSSSSVTSGSTSSNSGGSSIDGIWRASDGGTITLNNGSFEVSQGIRGTYTATASNITFNVKELSGNFLNQLDFGVVSITFENSKWYTKDQVIDAFRNFAKGASPWTDDEITSWLNSLSGDFNNMFPTRTGVINGNTMTTEIKAGEPTEYTKTT